MRVCEQTDGQEDGLTSMSRTQVKGTKWRLTRGQAGTVLLSVDEALCRLSGGLPEKWLGMPQPAAGVAAGLRSSPLGGSAVPRS